MGGGGFSSPGGVCAESRAKGDRRALQSLKCAQGLSSVLTRAELVARRGSCMPRRSGCDCHPSQKSNTCRQIIVTAILFLEQTSDCHCSIRKEKGKHTAVRESVLICVNVRPTPRVNSGKQLWHRTGIDLKCNCSGFFFFLFFVW